jgi:ABC-type transporter MlaC component
MIGAGTIINPIIKIVTTVAILAAVYFFAIKPALDTTEHVTDSINQTVNQSFDHAFDSIPANQQHRTQKALKKADVSKTTITQLPNSARAQLKIVACIQRAKGDVDKITRCTQ